jgi:hypothetical protein
VVAATARTCPMRAPGRPSAGRGALGRRRPRPRPVRNGSRVRGQ